MDIAELLQLVLKATNYPKEKHQDFLNAFYGHLFSRQIEAVKEVDEALAAKLSSALSDTNISDADFDKMWKNAELNPEVKEKVDAAASALINELVDDISASATPEEKRKILDSLPASA